MLFVLEFKATSKQVGNVEQNDAEANQLTVSDLTDIFVKS